MLACDDCYCLVDMYLKHQANGSFDDSRKLGLDWTGVAERSPR
jgi:DNA polymerase III epsilon subunit-like protein